jgi:hypothetical protein
MKCVKLKKLSEAIENLKINKELKSAIVYGQGLCADVAKYVGIAYILKQMVGNAPNDKMRSDEDELAKNIIKENIKFLQSKGLNVRTLTKKEARSGQFKCVGMFVKRDKND